MATASHAHDSAAAEPGRCVCAGEMPTRIDGTDRPHNVPVEARQEVAEAAAPERARPISQRNGAACGYARERRSSRARLPARAIYPMCSLPKYRGRHSEYPRGHSPVTHSLTALRKITRGLMRHDGSWAVDLTRAVVRLLVPHVWIFRMLCPRADRRHQPHRTQRHIQPRPAIERPDARTDRRALHKRACICA